MNESNQINGKSSLKKPKTTFKTVERFVLNTIPAAFDEFKSWSKSFEGGIKIIALIIISCIPILLQDDYYNRILTTALILSIFAASWDLLAGVTGQVSFGHALFLGIGGYFCGIFSGGIFNGEVLFNFPWPIAVLLGGLIAVLFGLIIGIPALRLKGPYLALGSLAFSLIIHGLINMGSLSAFLGGTSGVSQISPVSSDSTVEYFIILSIAIICIVSMIAIMKSNLGIILKAIRDDVTSTEASGINVTKYKIFAFMLSSFFAGIAGALWALNHSAVNPSLFTLIYSFYPIIMTSIGGLSSISGAVFGAFFFRIVSKIIEDLPGFISGLNLSIPENVISFLELPGLPLLIFSIILILVVRFAKEGVMKPLVKRLREFFELVAGK